MEKYDLSVHQGETFRQQLIFKDSAGAVRDLSGYAGFSQVRPDPDSDELICSMVCTVDGPAGSVVLVIPASVTAGIPAGCYAYDFAMSDTDENVRYYLGGRFSVLPSVTNVNEE